MSKTALLIFAVIILVNCSLEAVDFKVDFLLAKNKENHHTNLYRTGTGSAEKLILRRGATFNIDVTSQGTNTSFDFRLTPIDAINRDPITSNPVIRIPVGTSSPSPSVWGAWTTDGYLYTINIPVDAIVGIWRFDIVPRSGAAFPTTQSVVVLFNPWSSSDAVYLSDSTDAAEYIVNEDGMMWLGSSPSSGTGWTYDQFDNAVLEVTLSFLQGLTYNSRNDIIAVSRFLSSVINANNGDGLLYGRWQTPYTGGKEPWYWTGSGEIFGLYQKNLQTVKWGQCWVFAGTLVSAGRTIGIPARQITNFQSAHESSQYGPYRSSIDFLFDASGSPKGSLGSIWNFHAWVEFYFTRVDLSGADGWQVVDATPQEPSDGEYQLGPSSKKKILAKELTASYDTDFVESEVDAASRQYIAYDTGKAKHPFLKGYWLLSETFGETGKWISTKAKSSSSRSDVTSTYKTVYPKPKKLPEADQEVFISGTIPEVINLGDDLRGLFLAKCMVCSNTTRTISFYYEISIVDYTGQPSVLIVQNITHTTFTNENPHSLSISAPRKTYEHYVSDYSGFQISYFSKVYDGNGTWTGASYGEMYQILIDFPTLNLTIHDVETGSFQVDVAFHNPLSITLTGAEILISGAHISPQDFPVSDIMGDSDFAFPGITVALNDVDVRHECNLFVKLITNEVSQFSGNAVIHEYTKKI